MMAVGLQRSTIGNPPLTPMVAKPIARADADIAGQVDPASAKPIGTGTAAALTPVVRSLPDKVFEWVDPPAKLRPSAPAPAGMDIVATNQLPAAAKGPGKPNAANMPAPVEAADAPPSILIAGGEPAPTITATNQLPTAAKGPGKPNAANMPASVEAADAPPSILIAGGEPAPTITATNRLPTAPKALDEPKVANTPAAAPAAARAATAKAIRADTAADLRAALEALRKEAAMTPAQRIRRDVLKESKLTEDDVKAMSPDDRKKVEEKIGGEVKKRLAASEEQANRKRLRSAG